MRTVNEVKSEKIAWARSLPSGQAEAWEVFYNRFWGTEEGQAHLEKIASGELMPLYGPVAQR